MATAQAPTLLETARAYWEAGLTPMPRVPGDVNPHYITAAGEIRAIGWGTHKAKQPPWSTVERWFRLGSLATVGVTLLTGSHAMPRSAEAACLQILDIETPELFEAFREEVIFLGHEEILHRCVQERTAGDGGHLGFLCTMISDKQKIPLARRADQKILIELLQHQPCTVAPTQIRCKEEHAEGACYRLVHGTWAHPQIISPEQRQILLDVARRYTEVPEKMAGEGVEHTTGTRPGDGLNERADSAWWQDLLTRHGWHDVSRPGWARRGVYYFQRPGKVGHDVSATYGRTGAALYNFSSNAFPFEADTAYKPFAAYALLEHDGDYKAAARALATLYGLATHTATADALHQQRNGETPAPPDKAPPLPYSDYTNALAFVRDHGDNLRYCYPWHAWLVWTGTHWQRDMSGEVMRLAKQTVKRLARRVEAMDETPQIAALMAHIKTSLSTSKLKAMIENAQSEPGIAVQPEHLDTDPWLLNVANGTLDLKTGHLRDHAREDLLTVVLPVAYDATAACPLWEAFLHRIMVGNQNLIAFLQRAIGYALTGVIREHVLLILYGTGRNGKSTFLNLLRVLLGAYAMKAPSELLMVSHNDRHPTERADLFGKRFVSAIETEQGRKLAEVFVKEATGGDNIRARRMREDFWEFQPTHKVFLATNHKPVISGTDTAIWERIRLVPFEVTIPDGERDTTLPEKLEHELSGILTWALQGCRQWQEQGLGEPDEVKHATAGYRMEMDVLGQFIEDCCLTGSQYRVKASDLYEAYQHWCHEQGVQGEVQRSWGMRLTERGYESGKVQGRSWWKGIALLQVDERGDGLPKGKDGLPAQRTEKKEVRRPSEKQVDEGSSAGLPVQRAEKKEISHTMERQVDEGRPENGVEQLKNLLVRVNAVSSSTSSTSSTSPATEPTEPKTGSNQARKVPRGHTRGSGSVPSAPSFCPGCGRNSTWLLRKGREVCYKCGTQKTP